MVHYKLNYFEFKGRGELIRLIFHAAGQEFDDHRIQHADWHSLKSMSPTGQLPLLEITEDGKTFTLIQSMAIGEYLNLTHLTSTNKLRRYSSFYQLAIWLESSDWSVRTIWKPAFATHMPSNFMICSMSLANATLSRTSRGRNK